MANDVEIVLRARQEGFRQGMDAARAELDAALKGMADAASRQGDRLGRVGTQAGQALGQGVAGGARTAQASLGSLNGTLQTTVLRAGAAFVSFQALRGLFTSFTTVAGDFERARVQLNSLYRDADQGAAAFAWVKQFAKDTPFELAGVLKAFQTLKNFGIDPMGGTLQAVADQAALFGATQEQLQGISLALGQAWAANRLQGQDILQLINQGVPVWELLSKVTGQNTEQLRALSEQGALGRDVIAALIAEMGRQAGGAAQAQMNTFTGQVSNLKDAWAQLLDQIAQSGALDSLKGVLAGVLGQVGELAQNGGLQQFAQGASSALTGVVTLVTDVAGVLVALREELLLVGKFLLARKLIEYAGALRAMAVAGPLAAGGIATVSGALNLLKNTLLTVPLVVLVDQLAKFIGVAIEHRAAIQGMDAAYQQYQRTQQGVIDKTQAIADRTGILTDNLARGLTTDELRQYASDLQATADHYQAVFNQLTREGQTADNPAVVFANRQAREYREALARIKPLLDQRNADEKAATDRLTALKDEETQRIKDALDRQVEAYRQAQADVKAATDAVAQAQRDAVQNQKDIQAEFADLTRPAGATPTRADVTLQASAAQSALNSGDAETALRQAREAADALRDLRQGGDASATLSLVGQRLQTIARQAQAQIDSTAVEAAQAQQAAAVVREAAARQAVDDLVAYAKVLEKLPVGLDAAQAITDAQALRAALEAELAANPIVVDVVLNQPSGAGAEVLENSTVVTPPAYADGGRLGGHSPHSRADNLLFWGTAGEHVQPVSAVKHYGLGVMEALRHRQIPRDALRALMKAPRRALGGLLPAPLMPRLPAPLPALAAAGPPRGGDTINLTLPGGQTYTVTADRDTSAALARDVRLMGMKGGRR